MAVASVSDRICSICRSPIIVGDKFIAKCGHMFDRACLREWFLRSTTCPICRRVYTSFKDAKKKKRVGRSLEVSMKTAHLWKCLDCGELNYMIAKDCLYCNHPVVIGSRFAILSGITKGY